MNKGRKLMITVACLAAATFGALTAAQEPAEPGEPLPEPLVAGDPTGTVTGVVDGEEFTLHTYLVQAGLPEPSNTAYWDDWRGMGSGISVNVSAHESAGIGLSAWAGAIVLDFDINDELEHQEWHDVPDIGYFESISNPFAMTAGTLEFDSIELVNEVTLRLSGRFSGTFAAALSEDTREIEAEFWFDWVTLQEN